ncbi:MAG: C1 family peptidase [Acidobacteriota bacterium]|nr:C1 family peptidase [Acidobacteriota bacterium]
MTKTPKLGKGLGRKLDAPDQRDLIVKAQQAAPLRGISAPLPSHTDVFAGLSLPVYDQGSIGSCTANAGVLYRRFLSQRFRRYSAPDENLSRLFLYYQERMLPWNADPNDDAGASIRDACYVLAHTGVCSEQDDPYVTQAFASAPINDNPEDLRDALAYRIGAYHRVPDAESARSVLASGYAVMLGFVVYPSFEETGADGILRMPAQDEPPLGGHAVVIRGYDDTKRNGGVSGYFRVQNSWGPEWADKGNLWMPYEYIGRAEMSHPDMWMMHLGRPWRV